MQRAPACQSALQHGPPGKSGISIDETLSIARQVQRVAQSGVQLAIVVGGGNILRGAQFSAGGEVIKESTAHYMGMLATVLNGLALRDAMESIGCSTRVLTAIRMDQVAEPYILGRCLPHLEKKRTTILVAGVVGRFRARDLSARQIGAAAEVESGEHGEVIVGWARVRVVRLRRAVAATPIGQAS